MSIANLYHDWNIVWHLTWGNPEQCRYTAASLIESYDYLLSDAINMKEATRRLRLMRAKRRELSSTALSRPNNQGTENVEGGAS